MNLACRPPRLYVASRSSRLGVMIELPRTEEKLTQDTKRNGDDAISSWNVCFHLVSFSWAVSAITILHDV
jgi:hypothetical protein